MWTRLTSLDGTETAHAELVRPAGHDQLAPALDASRCIPRGAGLSYCGASAASGVRSVSSLGLRTILDFDATAGSITVEPGLTVGELFDFAVERGWYPPVLPGYPEITVGGCLGFNVHGKSQHHTGNFIDYVEELELYHPDHGRTTCSRGHHPDLFELTVGGFGLTGFITRARLRLRRLPGRSVLQRRIGVANLYQAVEVMDAQIASCDSLYSWNDLNARRESFGRGIVYAETYDSAALPMRRRSGSLEAGRGRLRVGIWNRPLVRLANRVYHRLELLRHESLLDLRSAAFPIEGKELYYVLFGRRGLREYQMLVPRAEWETLARRVERRLAASRIPATLGSLKLFQGETPLLHFSGTGVCLTLDVPCVPGSAELFAELDDFVAQAGGIVNVSKDSRLSAATASRLFPEYTKFKEGIEAFDPARRFDSALRRRIFGGS